MSLSIRVLAQRKLGEEDYKRIRAYNLLLELDVDIPDSLWQEIIARLGKDGLCEGEPITPPGIQPLTGIEVNVEGEGDVVYGGGMTIQLADLPPDTYALRIVAEV